MELAMIHPKDFFIIYLQVKLEFECWFIQSPGAIINIIPNPHVGSCKCLSLCLQFFAKFSFFVQLIAFATRWASSVLYVRYYFAFFTSWLGLLFSFSLCLLHLVQQQRFFSQNCLLLPHSSLFHYVLYTIQYKFIVSYAQLFMCDITQQNDTPPNSQVFHINQNLKESTFLSQISSHRF